MRACVQDLSVIDERGDEVLRKKISVNDPLRYGGVTMYQTDWSLTALTLRVTPLKAAAPSPPPEQPQPPQQEMSAAPGAPSSSGTRALSLPMASLAGRAGVSGQLWATFLPLEDQPLGAAAGATPRGISCEPWPAGAGGTVHSVAWRGAGLHVYFAQRGTWHGTQ